MHDNILEINDLHVLFRLPQQGVVRAVDGVSFRVPKAKTVALVGESGSGKTVIAQSVLRLLPKKAVIARGSIDFYTKDDATTLDLLQLNARGHRMRDIRGSHISMIFQEPMTSLSQLHTIGNQIMEVVRLHQRCSRAEGLELTENMLAMVGFSNPRQAINSYPFELSGGLRQRAMIAMALVCRPKLLIADEPTTALDVTIQAQILDLIKTLQQQLEMAVLLITHDLGVVANMADEVVVVYHGKVMESGRIEDIYNVPRHPYLKALMGAVPRIGMSRSERLVSVYEAHQLGSDNTTNTVSSAPPVINNASIALQPLLRVHKLCKTYNVRKILQSSGASSKVAQALDTVSFEIYRGECLGLVGESGCGKTTVSKVIMRSIDPDSGYVYYRAGEQEHDLLKLGGSDLFAFRRKVQYIFQDPASSLNPCMTVFDIINEPLYIHQIGDANERVQRVRQLMDKVGLDPRFLSRYPHSFSGGQRQRIGIARALALSPQLILCDEPVSALDVSVQAQILNLLKDLQHELSLTYLFISHNLAVVDYMADRIIVMCAGRVVEIAERHTLFNNPVHPYTKALLAAVPRADLNCTLDLRALMEGKVSDPASWPHPFSEDSGVQPTLLEVAAGHRVLALPELVA